MAEASVVVVTGASVVVVTGDLAAGVFAGRLARPTRKPPRRPRPAQPVDAGSRAVTPSIAEVIMASGPAERRQSTGRKIPHDGSKS
jgi:hypothetical protein